MFVDLIKLVNGKIPPYPIFIKPETELHWFDLKDLIYLRAPQLKIEQPPIDSLFKPRRNFEKFIEKILIQYANSLEQYAIDVLKGDFRIFAELEKIVKKRAEELRKGN